MADPNSPASSFDSVSAVVPPAAQERFKADAESVAGEIERVVEGAKDEAADQISALKSQAQDQISTATEKAKSFAAEQKDVAGDQLSSVADAISKVADELPGEQGAVAGYARDLAGGLKSVADGVKSRNVDELVGMAEDFGRQQPLAFLGAAALAGFVASRFVLASAQRRDGTPNGHRSSRQGDL